MIDLKQLWLISIDPNKLEVNGGILKMQNGSVKVKQGEEKPKGSDSHF